jgi:hypothetical protein
LVEARKKDGKQLRESLAGWRNEYVRAFKQQARAEHLKPLQRSTGRCATLYAAGRLAMTYDLVPWSRDDLLQAILTCQLDGLRHSQLQPQQADTSAAGLRRKLVRYLVDNRDQFWNLDKKMPRLGKHTFGSVPGYFARFKGKKWFYLTADQLKAVIGTGEKADQLRADLVADDLLDRASTGKYLVQRPIFSGAKGNKGYRWVHALRVRILQERECNL